MKWIILLLIGLSEMVFAIPTAEDLAATLCRSRGLKGEEFMSCVKVGVAKPTIYGTALLSCHSNDTVKTAACHQIAIKVLAEKDSHLSHHAKECPKYHEDFLSDCQKHALQSAAMDLEKKMAELAKKNNKTSATQTAAASP